MFPFDFLSHFGQTISKDSAFAATIDDGCDTAPELSNTILFPFSPSVSPKEIPTSPSANYSSTPSANSSFSSFSSSSLKESSTVTSQISLDLGGTLTKVVYFSTRLSAEGTPIGGRLNFCKFSSDDTPSLLHFLKALLKNYHDGSEEASIKMKMQSTVSLPTLVKKKIVIKATGGGAHRLFNTLQENLGVIIEKEDEMECLITGLNFLLLRVPFESFAFIEGQPIVYQNVLPENEAFPYLLVNIGSGVSIIKVTGKKSFQRVSGTSMGGGSLWGLLTLLTNMDSFDEMLELAQKGDNRNVDMLVGDIYGGDYTKMGLKSTTIASSMGKVYKIPKIERATTFKPEDIARSLLYMVSNNIGQIAYLNAKIHDVKHIYFGGFFIRGQPSTMHTLSYAVNFWSKGDMKALFLRHEGYLGAIGAILMSGDEHRAEDKTVDPTSSHGPDMPSKSPTI